MPRTTGSRWWARDSSSSRARGAAAVRASFRVVAAPRPRQSVRTSVLSAGTDATVADATAAVSIPWHRCIQKPIWLCCSTWLGAVLCAASARLLHAAGVWFLSKYTRAIQNDARAREGLVG